MKTKHYSGTWKEIWLQKGMEEGTEDDVYIYGGWEKTAQNKQDAKKKIEVTINRIIDELEIKPTDKVLEIGCGAGAFAPYMLDYLKEGMYVGVDFSKTLIEKCIRFYKCSAFVAEANDLPFKDKYFDKVFCYGLFFYFESKDYANQVMREMIRVSKDGAFIGEIAHASEHESKHLLLSKSDFNNWDGWELSDSWYEAYANERYNAKHHMIEKL